MGLQLSEYQIDNLAKKCSSSIGILYKIKNYLPEKALVNLYHTLFLSHITYAITAWGTAGCTIKNRLHVLQKRALRAISNKEYRCHSSPLFVKYNQLKIDDLCKLNVATFMYKYSNKILPSLFDDMFITNSSNHNYNTRFASNFQFPINKLEFGNKSISHQGAKVWNNIPSNIKDAKNIHIFKNNYKDNLISQYH